MATVIEKPILDSLELRVSHVGRDLVRSLSVVLRAVATGPLRPQWLARTLGVNTVLTSRLLKATQQHDPIAATHLMPGPEPLRRLIHAAAKKKVSPELIRDALDAVDRFERLIDAEAGDRLALDAILSGWLPDARQKIELIAKQSVFRGMSQLLGTACEVEHLTGIAHPSADDPARIDQVWLSSTQGLRRVRPGLPVNYYTLHTSNPMLALDGEPITDIDQGLLKPFCTKPLPVLEVARIGEYASYTLGGDEVGTRSEVNLTHAALLPRIKPLYRTPDNPEPTVRFTIGVGVPCKAVVFDVLLHKDVYPREEPLLHLYRTVGVFTRDSSSRIDADRLNILESVKSLGMGLAHFRTADTPQYLDMVKFICSQRRWNPDDLRGYRCRIDYPMYSSEITLSFTVPEAGRP